MNSAAKELGPSRMPALLIALLLMEVLLPVFNPTARAGETNSAPGYGGSLSCKSCHAEEYAAWSQSHHGLAERPTDPALDAPAFQSDSLYSQGWTASRTGTNFFVTGMGPNGSNQTYRIERVLGVEPLRQFLVDFPSGREQVLEAAFDPRTNAWFDVFGNQNRQPGEWGHWTGRGMNWNSMCAACHNTRVAKNNVPATDAYHTTMVETGVGCESCHGPLAAHNAWQQDHGAGGADDPTVHKLTRAQTLDNCGFCHARRGELTGDFQPGDDFHNQQELTLVDASETFYPDGQIHEEDYEFAPFLGSRMHAKGVSCVDCHNPHTARIKLPGNWLCLQCHGGARADAPVINPVQHSHHAVIGWNAQGVATNNDLAAFTAATSRHTGGDCVDCHMPQTIYMQRHARHDHGFTSPDPRLTKELGIPNACNRCHTDRPVDWAIKQTEDWYGNKMERPERARTRVIAAARSEKAEAAAGLRGLLQAEPIPYWRAVACGLLGPWAAEAENQAALLHALSDTNALVRSAAARSLGDALAEGPSTARDALRERLTDPVRSVRVAAAWALRAELDPENPAHRDLLLDLNVNADQPMGQARLGTYYFDRNQLPEALNAYQKAVTWDSNSPPLHENLAVVLSALNRSSEAAAQLRTATRLSPQDAHLEFELGLALNECDQPQQAIAALQEAVRLDAGLGGAWYNLGLALNRAGRTPEALAALQHGAQAQPKDPRIPYAAATILGRLGRRDEARVAAQQALKAQSDFAPAQELLHSLE